MKRSLQQIWDEMPLKSDKGDVHSYLSVYEEILAPYRDTAEMVLEIGLFNGASLLLWHQYFHNNTEIHGIDCSETPHGGMADLRPLIQTGFYNIHIMDGSSEAEIDRVFGDVKFNVVWDDSNHLLESQLQTVNIFKNRLAPNGIIILEDLQDIDKDRWVFDAMSDMSVEIIDLRKNKSRYDDVIVILKNKV